MMNAPTNKAMPAKTSRNVLKKLMLSFTARWLSAVISAPVSTSTSAGSTLAIDAVTASWEMPGPARTSTELYSPAAVT